MSRRKIRRSRDDRMIGGVCGGLARRLGWSPTTVRAVFVVGTVFPVIPGPLVYVLLWALLPLESGRPAA